ncbi:MAG TPA: hypothetical protein VEA69_12770, partial [Tepidisphaeraceae bacterium]|nr:hypothetical protein [Tepidisphaeraceae bacterium]
LGRRANTYDYQGEQVTIRMLTDSDLYNYSGLAGDDLAAFQARLREEFDLFDNAAGRTGTFGTATVRATSVAALAPLIVGFAIDAVRGELEKEAGVHQAQYGRTMYHSGFWKKVDPSGSWTPRWLGFEIERTTAATRKPGSPDFASRVVCAMIPANHMKGSTVVPAEAGGGRAGTAGDRPASANADPGAGAGAGARAAWEDQADGRLFVIKPLLFQAKTAKAKLMAWDHELTATVNVSLGATWVDEKQVAHQDTVATAAFDVSAYDMRASPAFINELKGQVAGWFAGVPVSRAAAAPHHPIGNGTFRLTVAVTETDPSMVKEAVERAAKYLKDNRDSLVERVTGN